MSPVGSLSAAILAILCVSVTLAWGALLVGGLGWLVLG
jgi:hypothetical protein